MPSYNIPEEIIGIPLFVPSPYDFFEIEVGGLPNGQDCLKINGATNRNYKAYQAAQILTPNVFWGRSAIHSQVFWLKAPSTNPSNTNTGEHAMMAVQDALDSQTNPSFSDGTWHIGASSGAAGRIQYKAGSATLTIDGARANVWKMVTITNDGTNLRAYLDGAAAAVAGPIAVVTATITGYKFLIIGAYSDVGSVNALEHNWRLAKWSFHDVVLSDLERESLYYGMFDGHRLRAAIYSLNPTRYYICNDDLPFDDEGSLNLDTTSSSGTFTEGGTAGEDGRNYLYLGSSGKIRAAYNSASDFFPNSSQTLVIMLKPDTLSGTQRIMQQSNGVNLRGELILESNGRLSYAGQNESSNVHYRSPIGMVTAGEWNLYIFRQQGVTNEWYKNNVVQAVGTLGNVVVTDATSRFDLGTSYSGGIGHVATYNSLLSTGDMTKIYQAAQADGWTI
jgi:hypothetical protein